jgi:hypothetical protein
MTTVNQQKTMFYNAGLMANLTILATHVGLELDFAYLSTCGECELRQMQDNLIEKYNAKLILSRSRLASKLN